MVAQSLFEHLLLENAEQAREIFNSINPEEYDVTYEEFADIFKDAPEYMGKFAEWLINHDESLEDIEEVYHLIIDLKDKGIELDKDINSFKGFNSFKKYINTLGDEDTEVDDNEGDLEDEEPAKPPVRSKISKPVQKQIGGFGKRLYVYGVLIKTRNETYVKFGDTRQNNPEDAKKYALDATIGKARGIVKDVADSDIEKLEKAGKDVDDISLIFVKDVTNFAEEENPDYVHGDRKGFDNYLRSQMPGESKVITNPRGGRSLELHKMNPGQTDLEIIRQWKRTLEDVLDRKKHITAKKTYTARPFHNEMNKKIASGKSDKHLLGAATGAGKEAVTLSSLIYINDERSELFNDDTIHVSTATIPSTELELFEELSKVSGMKMGDGSFIEFSRIKPYCLEKFANSYQNKLTPTAFKWFNENVEIVKNAADIPKKTSGSDEVVVLFGSFIHLGRQAKPTGDYNNLGSRIGILSIGEGHQFLSSGNNKLWNDIKENFKYKFLFLITGTPYDFIFNEAGHLYFTPEERTLFTRNDLYKAKEDGEEAFQKYPKLNYYQLDTEGIVSEMKKDTRWEDDKHGFTWEKFLKYDKKKGKFKYDELIIHFFKRLLFVDDGGFDGETDNLSILNAKDLSDYAKKHVIIALPVGGEGVGVATYIPKLVELLERNSVLGKYTAFQVYNEKDSLSTLKEHIELEKSPTVLFTCNKLLTGTNIPQWGSLVFLRPIGGSIKFFEQATGRVGRPFDNKDTVGIFLGNLELAAEISIVVDEKISVEKGENLEYSTIVNQTLKNYNWFGIKNGQWQKFKMADLVEAQESLAGNIDYGSKLAIGNPHPPKNFYLEFKAPTKNIVKDKIDIDSQDNKGAKNKQRLERHKQLALKFEESKNPEQMWKNMIETHIPKLLMIALIENKHTIQEVGDLIKKAENTGNDKILDMVGDGVLYVKDYIDDKDQLNIPYLNRWIDRLTPKSTKNKGLEGIKERYNIINEKMDISKLDENLIFDPMNISSKMIKKLNEYVDLKNQKNVGVLDKSGSFTLALIEKEGFENSDNITVITHNELTSGIINYILGENKKRIKVINIENIKKMPKFDVIVGNPPYQGEKKNKGQGSGNAIWQKFVELSYDSLENNGYMCLIHPIHWRTDINRKKVKNAQDILFNNQIIYLNMFTTPFQGIVTVVDWYVLQKTLPQKPTIIENEDGKYKKILKKEFIPNLVSKKADSIINKVFNTEDNGLVEGTSWWFDPDKGENKTYKYAHGLSSFTRDKFKYYDTPHKDQHTQKLIIPDLGNEGFYDKGELGIAGHVHYIPVKNKKEAEFFKKILKSKLMKFLQKMYSKDVWLGSAPKRWNNPYPMTKIKLDNVELKDDQDIYDYFNLTPEEINYIDSHIK